MKTKNWIPVTLFALFILGCSDGAKNPAGTEISSSNEDVVGSSIQVNSSSSMASLSSSNLGLGSSSSFSSSGISSSAGSSSSSSLTSSSSNAGPISTETLVGASGTFVDARDDQSYKWVKIGFQYWMAENLNIDASSQRFAGYASEGTGDYARTNSDGSIRNGMYYDWASVMNKEVSSLKNPSGVQGICPEGWHLPSKEEVIELRDFLVQNSADIKSKSEWETPGKDQYGFNARPSGNYAYSWKAYGVRAYFWMATAYKSDDAYFMTLYPTTGVEFEATYASSKMNVRCLSDQYDGTRETADYTGKSGVLHDARGNTDYAWVGIGQQKWFAQDMKLTVGVDYFSDAKESILYHWAAALNIDPSYNSQIVPEGVIDPKNHQGICPDGSRIPNARDWQILADYFGGASLAGKKLKAASFSGTDDVGFKALATGVWFNGSRTFGTRTYYVSAESKYDSSGDYVRLESNSDQLASMISDKVLGTAVRCILVEL